MYSILKLNMKNDKIYDISCSKKRIDGIYDCTTHYVFLEVDEFQHKKGKYECEIIRMKNLSQEFGGTPVIFIRFNPDLYKTDGKTFRANIEGRMPLLMDTIKKLKTHKCNNLLSVIYLYYDGFNGKIKIEKINI